jgi:ABC-type glutathione transport system ATPase component
LNLLCRFENDGRATNIFAAPPGLGHNIYNVTAVMLWGLSLLGIVGFPAMAIVVEKYVHGISKKGRKLAGDAEAENRLTALEVDSPTKCYSPSLLKRCCCRRSRPTVAVDALSLASQKHQVLCLLGVNGSGKTTTMDVITGNQRRTSGSIRINAPASKIGKLFSLT